MLAKAQVASSFRRCRPMAERYVELRCGDSCVRCGAPISAGSKAWWDPSARTVICSSCVPAPPLSSPSGIERGEGGRSTAAEHARRRARQQAAIEATWGSGTVGRFIQRVTAEPKSTTAFAKGSEGERRLGRRLDRELAAPIVVLHDRKVPGTRGNIDHIVVAPTGIWLIDAKNYTGRVRRRDVGGWRSSDERLYVGNRDRTKLIESMGWQVAAVRAQLDRLGHGDSPVCPVVCFTTSDWGWFAKPFCIGGVLVIWPAALVTMIKRVREDRALDGTPIDILAGHLSSSLPAHRSATGVERS